MTATRAHAPGSPKKLRWACRFAFVVLSAIAILRLLLTRVVPHPADADYGVSKRNLMDLVRGLDEERSQELAAKTGMPVGLDGVPERKGFLNVGVTDGMIGLGSWGKSKAKKPTATSGKGSHWIEELRKREGSVPGGSRAKSFDMEEAFLKWDAAVGCDAFREKHKELIRKYSPSATPDAWPPNPSLQALHQAECGSMNSSGVHIHFPALMWMGGQFLQDSRVCPRCGLVCQFTTEKDAGWRADAHVFIRSLPDDRADWWLDDASAPVQDRLRVQKHLKKRPLIVLLNMEKLRLHKHLPWCTEADAHKAHELRLEAQVSNSSLPFVRLLASKACPDVVSDFAPDSDVQLTYASFAVPLKAGQTPDVSSKKLQGIPIHRSVSNCEVAEREELAEKILSEVSHDSFGKCLNSFRGQRSMELLLYPYCRHIAIGHQSQEIMRCVRSHYKFDLTFENSFNHSGYVTEKFFVNLEAGTVPVYYGAPDIAEFAPPESYIDARQFSTAKDLIAFIKEVDQDPVKYMQFHAWRYCNVWGKFTHAHALGWSDWPCRLCEKVAAMKSRRSR